MTLERLADQMGGVSNRRGFLRRLGAAGLASAAYLGATAPRAEALCTTHGCDLCRCPGSCSYTCSWCWWGRCHNHNGNRRQHRCCEGYGPVSPANCSGQCSFGLNCSFLGNSRNC